MSSLIHTIKLLEEKLEDLQCNTKYCVNNYDYHHKNDEDEIIKIFQDVLQDSLQDGEEFLSHMKSVRALISSAREKCSELDELLLELGVNPETTTSIITTGNCPTASYSFNEGDIKNSDGLESNKENKN